MISEKPPVKKEVRLLLDKMKINLEERITSAQKASILEKLREKGINTTLGCLEMSIYMIRRERQIGYVSMKNK